MKQLAKKKKSEKRTIRSKARAQTKLINKGFQKFMSFLISAFIILIIVFGIYLIVQSRSFDVQQKQTKEQTPLFDIDQILLKVLIKENEFVSRPIRVMNTGNKDQSITVFTKNLADIVAISESNFITKPGQTKIINLKQLQPQ